MPDKLPNPNELVAELVVIRSSATHAEPGPAIIERLLAIIRDLAWYRYYGFKHDVFEALIREDPAARQICVDIEEAEKKDVEGGPSVPPPFNLKTRGI